MKLKLSELGYRLNSKTNVWSKPDFSGIAYSDGDEVEQRIAAIIKQASDLTVLSAELRQNCTDWPSLYHLSSARANILRPFESSLNGNILEIGAGCGAITRYLGECNGNILALEGSTRRAAIARSRTRDLPNVTVVADNFEQFQCNEQFDIITLIGVLEYANLFISHGNPALSMLQSVRSLLKPKGKLIIAIENQLGLKYFAGAPEDHFGKSMYGIEDRYQNDQPQTYGRQVLSEMLKQAGFLYSEFMAPFPDYKLPVSIVTEKGFSNKGFDAAALAWQCVKRDPQLPLVLAFAPELVWPSLFKNDVALDFSNSFLVVVGDSVNDKADASVLAWHFTTERSKEFCKVTRFLQRTNRLIETYCYPLSPDFPNHGQRRLLTFGVQEKAEYAQGRPLSQELIHIVTRDGWRLEDIGNFFKQYLEYLVSYASAQGVSLNVSSLESKIPGEYFDLIPQNIIIGHDGKWNVIDQEWVLNENMPVGWLLFRSLLPLIHSVTRFGICADEFDNTPFGFIKAVFKVTGFVATEAEIESFVRFEFAVQEEVAGIKLKVDQSLNWLRTASLHRQNLNQALADRDGQITSLNQTVAERDEQIAKLGHTIESLVIDRDFQKAGFEQLQSALTQLAHERDGQIAGLNQAVAERDEQIAKLGHTVESLAIDRDFQKAGFEQLQSALTQLAHERDGQIAGLNQAVAERDEQIAGLNQAVAERDEQIAKLGHTVESLVIDRDFQKAGFEQLQNALTQLAHERDGQIAGLNQAVAERDEQIAGLNQAVSERDKQIASLNQAKIDHDQLIAGILNSISWKLTKPLRFAGRLLRGDWTVVRASIDSLRKTKENPFAGGKASLKNNVLLKFDADKPQNKQNKLPEQVPYGDKRILLVSYYCPSRAHAGGLRILDIYSLIKSEFPTIGLDLYTCRHPEIDWSYDDVESIFDNIYYSETEDLSVEGLLNQCKERPYCSVIDLQFHQSAKHIDAFRALGAKILFTPIESLARCFLIDVKEAFHHARGIPFKNIVAGVRNTIEEVTYCLKADEVICVSKPDATVLRTISLSRKIGYMESGLSSIEFKDAFSESSMELTPRKKENIIVYVAFFGSQTNILAMKWYLDRVHPLIKKKVPDYMLHVVGRGDLSVFTGYQDEAIIFVGAVPSVGPYINEAKVGIAPALGGSGLRGKMSQYGLYGVPTVASPIAVKGSAYEDGVDIYITEVPEIFAERCIVLLKDEETNKRIGNMARQTALRHYTWESKLDIIRKVYALDEVVQ